MQRLQCTFVAGFADDADAQNTDSLCHDGTDTAVLSKVVQRFQREAQAGGGKIGAHLRVDLIKAETLIDELHQLLHHQMGLGTHGQRVDDADALTGVLLHIMVGGSAGSGSGSGARFPDEGGGGDGWGREGRGTYSWYNCSDDEEDKERCADDGAYLDGKPATWQKNPVLGKGWFCYEKNGTDEVMCVVSSEPMEEDKFLDLCVSGSVEEVRRALAKGADPNQRTSKPIYASSALHKATMSEYAGEVIKLLLDAGADVNIRDEEGRTPLILALGPMPDPVWILRPVRALLAGGADPTIKDNDGHDALWHARRLRQSDEYGEYGEEDKAQVAEIVRLVEQAMKRR